MAPAPRRAARRRPRGGGRTSARSRGRAWCSSMPRPSTATRPRRARLGDEGRRLGAIDEVGDERRPAARRRGRAAGRRSPAMPSEVVLTMVAAAGARRPAPRPSRAPTSRGPKCAAQRLGAGAGAVGDADLRRALGEQRRDDGAGAAAGAEHQRRPGRGAPVRRLLAEVGDEAVAVGIVGVDRAVGAEGEGVGRADRGARGRSASVASASAASLCGMVTLTPRKPSAGSARQAGGEALGRQADRDVVAVDP